MMQWLKFVVMGILFWLIATAFFRLLGPYVLLGLQETYFITFLLLLLSVILLLVAGISLFVRLRMYRDRGSATRFGFWLALSGLVMNGFIFMYRSYVFPAFTPEQHESYIICIIFGCALALWVPSLMDRLIRAPREPKITFQANVDPETHSASEAKPDIPPRDADILDEPKP
ncbi:hypothetical protein OIN60_21860 [Paenibacillus sp. P96]|uniref:Uncharacterized protein n=1 Tax=Paenibacillus zeirhizosphaerae TaxID=2987519 RepID=A0ABT9FXB5_9BACL|nr:hypothetical protein [Paenibacillus sp. P96]MDP4099367.1 hypothetical protein [Paenibacillus sp. P96]